MADKTGARQPGHTAPMFGGMKDPARRWFLAGFVAGTLGVLAILSAGQVWGNMGSWITSIVVLVLVVVVTSWLRTRPR